MSKAKIPKIDKRVQKTKKLLSESLISLILNKGYESISIQDILDKARIGRSTFYFHYENKDQLFLDGLQNLEIQLFAFEPKSSELSLRPMFEHIAQNLRLGQAILGTKAGDLFFDMLKYKIAERLAKDLKPPLPHKGARVLWKYDCLAAASAVLSLTRSWLDDGLPLSAEQVCLQAENYIRALLGRLT
jgi:AcrR family transcriptional regulator